MARNMRTSRAVFAVPVVAAAVLAASFAAWGAPTASSHPAKAGQARQLGADNKTLVVSNDGDPTTMQRAFTTNVQDNPAAVMGIALISLNATGQARPQLARSWKVSRDNKHYTFFLNHWRWSDGKPVTSGDVAFSILKVLRPYNPFGSAFYGNVKSVSTPSAYVAVVNLKQPQDMLLPLSNGFGTIVPKHVYAGTNIRKNPANFKPVVAGPYMLGNYTRGSSITLVRNPDWAGPKTYFDRIIFREIQQESSVVSALRTGEIDLAPQEPALAPRDVDAFSNNSQFQVARSTSPNGEQDTLLFNTLTPPLNNVLVRRAIATAIDRNAIVSAIYVNTSQVATGFISNAGVLKRLSTKNFLARYNYNVQKANQLLDQAGFPKGSDGTRFRLKMTVPSDFPGPQLEDAIASYLGKVGIKVDASVADFNTNWARVFQWARKDPWQGFNLSVMPGMWTAPVNLESYYDSSRYQPGTLWSNAWAYRNPKADALLQLALRSAGAREVNALTRLQEQLAQDLPTFPLVSQILYEVGAKSLRGMPMGAGLHLQPPIAPFYISRAGG